jgi:hypothetical protein
MKKRDVIEAVAAVRQKIEEAARLASAKAGRTVTPEEVLREALGVTTLTAPAEELTAEQVAAELRISPRTVRDANRAWIRSGGKEGLGPYRQYGRYRRFPRPVVEAWKKSREVSVTGHGRAA